MMLVAYDDIGEIPAHEWEALRVDIVNHDEACHLLDLCTKLPPRLTVPLAQVEQVIATGWHDVYRPDDGSYEYCPELQPVSHGTVLDTSVRKMVMEGIDSPGASELVDVSDASSEKAAPKKTDHDPELQSKADTEAAEFKRRYDRWPTKIEVAKVLKKDGKLSHSLETIARRIRDSWSDRPNSSGARSG